MSAQPESRPSSAAPSTDVWVVSSRATGTKSSHQVTIPAAIAKQLPDGKSVRWELRITPDGLSLRYLGPDEPTRQTPKAHVPWLNGGGA